MIINLTGVPVNEVVQAQGVINLSSTDNDKLCELYKDLHNEALSEQERNLICMQTGINISGYDFTGVLITQKVPWFIADQVRYWEEAVTIHYLIGNHVASPSIANNI